MTTPWTERYAQRMQWVRSSAIRELLKLTEQPDVISFAGGLPAPELFPVKEFAAATERVLSQQGAQALQYSTTEGYRPLREYIIRKMAAYGIQADVDNVLITSGAQQALDLIGKLLINPGDRILTERPTYLGAIQSWRAYQAEFVTVDIDEQGLQTDHLAEALATGPKFMYILPNFQNPAGVTLPLERRLALIDMANAYGVPIIEDDPYGELRYDGDHLPPLVVLDAERFQRGKPFEEGNVIYLGTFSKTLAPGLRLGWMVAPRRVIERSVLVKQGMDLHTSTFTQMLAYEVIQNGFLKEHVGEIRRVYKERRDLMLTAMSRTFPAGVYWTKPAGGLFIWVTLPSYIAATPLLEKALERKVAFVPGDSFYPDGTQANTFRLNFSNALPRQIETGIGRLGELLTEEMEAEQRKMVWPEPALVR
ncbi:MAG: PLP-dependent aminotransferase family protein [Chloroflexota bacterium]|jgi:2-aminoadipate transaminase